MGRVVAVHPERNNKKKNSIGDYITNIAWFLYFISPLVFFLIAPVFGQRYLVAYEFATELLIAGLVTKFCLKSYLGSKARFPGRSLEKVSEKINDNKVKIGWIILLLAFSFLLLADGIYNFRLIFGLTHYGAVKMIGGFSYSAFMFFLVFYFASVLPIFKDGLTGLMSIFFVFMVYGYLVFVFIVTPYIHLDPPFPVFHQVTNIAYSVLTTCLVSLIIPVIIRTKNTRDFLFLQAILFAVICDFCLRYQTGVLKRNIFVWAEPGWAMSFASVFFLLTSKKKEAFFSSVDDELSDWSSIRVFLTLAICMANLLFWLITLLFGLHAVGTGENLSLLLAILYMIWFIANFLSLTISNSLMKIRDLIYNQLALGENESEVTELKLAKVDSDIKIVEIRSLILAYNPLIQRINSLIDRLFEQKRKVILEELAEQVSHDIRSPLAALQMIMVDADELPEEKRNIVRSAVNRITDIANDLLAKKDLPTDTNLDSISSGIGAVSTCLISSIVEEVVTEKRILFGSRPLLEIKNTMIIEGYGLFAEIEPKEMKRLLSNVINNSVESIQDMGSVEIELTGNSEKILIKISDNGVGIPKQILTEVFNKGVTFGKEGGKGLGLFHAKKVMETIGGIITLDSNEGVGTAVSLELPRVKEPSWFVPSIGISSDTLVVVLDDDTSVYHVWQKRFEPLLMAKKLSALQYFSSADDFESWFSVNRIKDEELLLLVDYELIKQGVTGLDLIEKLGIQEFSVLVTSRFENLEIRERCQRLGVRIIPKLMAAYVPIYDAN